MTNLALCVLGAALLSPSDGHGAACPAAFALIVDAG